MIVPLCMIPVGILTLEGGGVQLVSKSQLQGCFSMSNFELQSTRVNGSRLAGG